MVLLRLGPSWDACFSAWGFWQLQGLEVGGLSQGVNCWEADSFSFCFQAPLALGSKSLLSFSIFLGGLEEGSSLKLSPPPPTLIRAFWLTLLPDQP